MYKGNRVLGVILARKTSSRLKDKMLLSFGKSTVVETVIERITKSKLTDEFILATSTNPQDSIFEGIALRNEIGFFRGSENDVVLRILSAIERLESTVDIVVRICADNPLMMPTIVDEAIVTLIYLKADLITPFRFNTYPFGYSAVIMTIECLKKIAAEAKLDIHREHVENFCFDFPNKFNILYQKAPDDLRFPELRLTLDYEADYHRLKSLYELIKDVPLDEQPRRLIEIVKECNIGMRGPSR